jgi:cytochrome c peroxidase
VSETAPYFHDGVSESLEQAVRMMGKHQLGLDLEKNEVDAIVAWLHTLTGDLPSRYVASPELPESTEQTPKPDKS